MILDRCTGCGKFSRSPIGEYRRADGSAGYIRPWDDQGQGPLLCEECRDGRCPVCASADIVQTHPSVPGPEGWGGRCKVCCRVWGDGMPEEVPT